ncbi:hypothetical protein PCANC_23137 [Puccinia coronata f. sp. avenae]|uniref:U1 small nuclear ribonucleoprotein 70 kDa n=1 Tax=Puccinia coronata f. sp. avenae TaxID=200324 RepID=A0A2N5SBI3_9BASI|nr:hypothetical protein PCANC_23137 [Puccinia coronata f. sp. avenae]PLW38318.1 hypothetical protein PCASD_08994 [Puccinia coronata f. sp. avenae]
MVGTHQLPPNLLKLFAPRPPLPYSKPLGRDPDVSIHKKHISCVSPLLDRLKLEAASTNEDGVNQENGEKDPLVDRMPPETLTDSMQVRFERRQEERRRRKEEQLSREENYDPKQDPNATGDPYRTLFISRLSFEVTESDLKREFDMYGPIEKLVIVKNKLTGKSRGYAFILFEREKDMKAAYKDAEGLKIKGRRILVDVERGRTVKGWKPRRLGGGLGGRPKAPTAAAVAPELASASGGFGFRGGSGGGARPGGGGGGFRSGGGGGGSGGGFRNSPSSGPGGGRMGDRGFGGGGRPGGDRFGSSGGSSRGGRERGYGDRPGGSSGGFGSRGAGIGFSSGGGGFSGTGANAGAGPGQGWGSRQPSSSSQNGSKREYEDYRNSDAYGGGGHDDHHKKPRY